VQSVLLRPQLDDEIEQLTAQLWELATIGILEEGDCIRAFFVDPIDTSSLSYVVEVREEQESPAYQFSHEDWTPLLIGNKFFVAPSCVPDPTPDGRLRLTVDSPTAFGTGRHETTQLALEYLEETIQGGETVVDIGCGSGILCAAAKMLGAGTVIGCDIDELAVGGAVRDFGIPTFTGSTDAIRAGSADIVLVNISTKVIEVLAPELRRVAKPNARVFLSGFIHGSEPSCFAPREIRECGDWLCFIGTEKSIHAPQLQRGKIIRHSSHWW
jgi:ribosomal protein L11 methyltransferase